MIINPSLKAKLVDKDIANSLLPGTSISRMKDILGTPESYYKGYMTPYSDEEIEGYIYYYSFLNAEILVATKDDISISSITIQSSLDSNYPVKIVYPFDEHETGYLGEVCITSDMIERCNNSFSNTTVRDACFGIEVYYGRIGRYMYYTFLGSDPEKIGEHMESNDISVFLNSKIYGFCISVEEKSAVYINRI